jgi:preprotein translocase subunit SecY
MFLALMQAIVLAIGLETMGLSRNPGALSRLLTLLTVMGATAALVVMARVVDRAGLGSGFAILLLADIVPNIVVPLENVYTHVQRGAIASPALFSGVLYVAVLVGATLWLFSPYRLPANDSSDHPALVSRPACGLMPLTLVPAVLKMAAAFWTAMNNPTGTTGTQWHDVLPTVLLASIAAAALFAFLFNRLDQIARVWKSLSLGAPGDNPCLKPAMFDGRPS